MGSGSGMRTPPPRSRLTEAGVPAPLRTSWPGSGASVYPRPPPPTPPPRAMGTLRTPSRAHKLRTYRAGPVHEACTG